MCRDSPCPARWHRRSCWRPTARPRSSATQKRKSTCARRWRRAARPGAGAWLAAAGGVAVPGISAAYECAEWWAALAGGDEIEVTKSRHRAAIVKVEEKGFFETLRSKLHWGARGERTGRR